MKNLRETFSRSPPGQAESTVPDLPILPPRNALIELAVFFLVVLGLQLSIAGFPDLNEIQPHPFWFPVLLLSLQYGTVSGLLAAGVAILSIALMGWPELDVNEDLFNYRMRIWTQPVLWIAAAIILGQFRMRQIEQHRELRGLVDDLHNQRGAIAKFAHNLKGRCDILERQIAGRRDPAAYAVLDAFATLGSDDPSALTTGFPECAESIFAGGKCSVFALCDGGLLLATRHGWEAGATWRKRINNDEALYHAMVEQMRGVSVLRAEDELVLAGQGLAAVPVFSPAGDRVLGMLKIEYMDPAVFNDSTLRRLEVVAAQLGAALELHGGDAAGMTGFGGMSTGAERRKIPPASRPAAEQQGDTTYPSLKKPKVVS